VSGALAPRFCAPAPELAGVRGRAAVRGLPRAAGGGVGGGRAAHWEVLLSLCAGCGLPHAPLAVVPLSALPGVGTLDCGGWGRACGSLGTPTHGVPTAMGVSSPSGAGAGAWSHCGACPVGGCSLLASPLHCGARDGDLGVCCAPRSHSGGAGCAPIEESWWCTQWRALHMCCGVENTGSFCSSYPHRQCGPGSGNLQAWGPPHCGARKHGVLLGSFPPSSMLIVWPRSGNLPGPGTALWAP
jgi:hypothetical protein